MATLTVWKFGSADGAERAAATLVDLSKQHLIEIVDAAIVEWPTGKKRPKTRQAFSPAGAGAFNGAFWGLLFGILFFVPLLGALVGAAAGALSGSLADVGINDDFIASVRDKVTPGTSALFLMSVNEVTDRVRGAFTGSDVELMHTNLTAEQEQRLRDTFAEAD